MSAATTSVLDATVAAPARARRRPLWLRTSIVASAAFLALIISAALFPTVFAPYDPLEVDLRAILAPPSVDHWFGTDDAGRDVFSRIVHGAAASLAIGFGATIIGVVGGSLLGILAGLGPRWADASVMRLVDCLVAVPDILLAMIVITLAGGGTMNALIAVGIASIPSYARIIRAQSHQVRVAPYIEAARTLGIGSGLIAVRHVFPNAFRPLIPVIALRIGGAIGAGAGLSFLGLGAQPPEAEWGAMIASARNFLVNDPLLVFWPSLAVTLTVLAVGVIGRELKQRLEGRGLG
ncbi:ABC transporter permease [Agromyces larvae]|uniref:ABC transporter permease n=1 Tax=Agromyces larvae TaxID=2929802 RepID=A0ABY4BVZ5_9MICO|nr:ABC transporter permease [Agromyces larvae]UOE43353.1 ABC transporter permease [Agromyces larvae]